MSNCILLLGYKLPIVYDVATGIHSVSKKAWPKERANLLTENLGACKI